VPNLYAAAPPGGDWRHQDPAPPQAYHAGSHGLYSSELVRRADARHRRLAKFCRDEIAEPLGIDFWIQPSRRSGRARRGTVCPRARPRRRARDQPARVADGDVRPSRTGALGDRRSSALATCRIRRLPFDV
jgi:CubicO group peptidase (beta-lactamase class C family)